MKRIDRGRLAVLGIVAGLAGPLAVAGDPPGHPHGAMQMAMPAAAQAAPAGRPETVLVEGVVLAVLPDRRQVKVRHQAIDAWQMPGMQMRFELAPTVPIDRLVAGQRIRFRLQRAGIGRFRIVGLE